MPQLHEWLSPLDALPLECDGLTRAISTLLARDAVLHRVCVGSLEVASAGRIPIHWWVELPDGTVIDYRARMWLGASPNVPHGVFRPDAHHTYQNVPEQSPERPVSMSRTIFHALTGRPLDQYPSSPLKAQR